MALLSQTESSTSKPVGVLMVGSVPLKDTRDVLSKLSNALPGRMATFPDGETAERFNFIGFQRSCFPEEVLRWTPFPEHKSEYSFDSVKPTGYDTAAISSYSVFADLKNQGVIPKEARFQISLPSPLNTVASWCKEEFEAVIEPFYEKRMEEAVQHIAENIPHDDMVIQLDLCYEIIMLEYELGRVDNPQGKAYFTPLRSGLLDRLSRFVDHIPTDIELAIHLCYGDYQHKHFVEPLDTSVLVDFANDVIETFTKTHHQVRWLHLPVPRDRTDRAYFEPLNKLQLGNETHLFLGLVHANDESGTKERIATASSVYAKPFGVATECGLGRTPAEELDSILSIAKEVTDPFKM